MKFNASKSISFSTLKPSNLDLKFDNTLIPKSEGFIYLGLPIDNDKFIENLISDKFRNREKSFYSLISLGCKPNSLSPKSIAFIYKQFSLSILRFGLDISFIKRTFINQC